MSDADLPTVRMLDASSVMELARRELAPVVGHGCGARFFLAGGAFKTLLHGRPPRDLDLWAASEQDRATLVDTLRTRGARTRGRGPFSDLFELGDRTVDVPDAVSPSVLEELLARFDVALSAVGVEHAPEAGWRASVHPLAIESARTQRVLLLKPLVNWRYALTTLTRARRYARELGYELAEEEEQEVWRAFAEQDRATQLKMIANHAKTSPDDAGVGDDAYLRLRL